MRHRGENTMSRTVSNQLVSLIIALFLAGCTSPTDDVSDPETPTEADTDTDTDADSDADTDTDVYDDEFNMDQTLSDGAQRATLAFDGLAFITGDLCSDSFLPPGKVSDFMGFQALRDNDPDEMGHNTDFAALVGHNALYLLDETQFASLVNVAEQQVDSINAYAEQRFVLMDAFRRLHQGNLPPGTTELDPDAVKAYSAQLYQIDAQISLDRAQALGDILASLDASQIAYLDDMASTGMLGWADVQDQVDTRGMDHDAKVTLMTIAGQLFSWYAGSIERDVYFCPERQATYFGSFYLKDAAAMGNPGFSIDTELTKNGGESFLALLDAVQEPMVSSLVDNQRDSLYAIADVREEIATELREHLAGGSADTNTVMALMGEYGELDGAIIHMYATAFSEVADTLTADQMTELAALRSQSDGDVYNDYPCSGAYLYSENIAMPSIPNTDFLFR